MLAILGGLGAALAWTVTTLAAARATKLIDSWSLIATVMVVGLIVATPTAVISGVPAGLNWHSTTWLLVAGFGNIGGLFFTYRALRIGKVGLVAPITSTEGAVAAVIAVVAGEHLAATEGIPLVAVAIGVALSAAAPGKAEGRRVEIEAGLLAAGAAVCFGFGLYATARVGENLGIPWAVLPPRVVGVALIAIPLAISGRWRMTREALPYVVLCGIFEVVGFALYAFGARHGLAVSAVLASQFAAISAVIGFIALRERLVPIQVAGVATIVIGVSVLGALHG
jgi:drug/metabolite transporter (DMT)-like permease